MTTIKLDRSVHRWQHVHADWWQDDQGNDIHRIETEDGAVLYHCHIAGSSLPWNAIATSLDEAIAIFDEERRSAS